MSLELVSMLAFIATATAADETPLSKITTEFSAQLFTRARATQEAGEWDKSYALTRARFEITLRYEDVLRVTLEPDFAAALCSQTGAVCDDAELSDAFIDIDPFDELDFRAGHAKTPFGVLETTNAWRLPSHRRGLISDLTSDRLRFGGRKLGAKTRLRLRDVPMKPSIELGVYADADRSFDEDAAVRVIARPFKNAEIQLQGYAATGALTAGGTATAGALAFLYERKKFYGAAELQIGRARLLTIAGDAGVDSTFVGFRALAAYAFTFDKERTFELEPYLGLDVFDPNADTYDDLGGEVRGGLNFFFLRMFRVSIEVDRRTGDIAFPEPKATVLSIFLGASLG